MSNTDLKNYYRYSYNNFNSNRNENLNTDRRKNKITYSSNYNLNKGMGRNNPKYRLNDNNIDYDNSYDRLNIDSRNNHQLEKNLENRDQDNNKIRTSNNNEIGNYQKFKNDQEDSISNRENKGIPNFDNQKKSKNRIASENIKNDRNSIEQNKPFLNNIENKQNSPEKKVLDITLNYLYKAINSTFPTESPHGFDPKQNNIDYKILDRKLKDIFGIMLDQKEKYQDEYHEKGFISLFLNTFSRCDKDKDNVLIKEEFIECLMNDKYISLIIPPQSEFSNNNKYSKSNKVSHEILFNLLDDKRSNFVNFLNYMKLRMYSFSWRKCSVLSPFMDETNFECAIDIISGSKTASKTRIRQLYYFALYNSNNPQGTNINFITFVGIANSIRLYGEINLKDDDDISRNEFNMALDGNVLPIRYNQLIIDQMFELVKDFDKYNHGIDLKTFVFYDFLLLLFNIENPERRYHLNKKELIKVFNNPMFPNKTLNEISLIPQFNLTKDSYKTYQYFNSSIFMTESDYFYKSFLEIQSKSGFLNKIKNNLRIKNKHQTNEKSNLNKNANLNKIMNKNSKSLFKKAYETENSYFNLKTLNKNEKFQNNLRTTTDSTSNNNNILTNENNYPDEIELYNNKFTNSPISRGLSTGFNNLNLTFNLNETSNKIFEVLDSNSLGSITFKDFAIFYQLAYIFTKEDKFSRGFKLAEELYDIYNTYCEFPSITFEYRERAIRFNSFKSNQRIDLLSSLIILRIDEIVKFYNGKTELQTMNEIELKSLLIKINMKYIPDSYLNDCFMGLNNFNIPKYDWECSFLKGMSFNLNYFEVMSNYLKAKINKLNLTNTIFYNIDPNYQ